MGGAGPLGPVGSAMGGRPPVPTNLKPMNGMLNPTRENRDEPKLTPHIPEAPARFNDEERAAWEKFARLLEPLRVTTDVDAAALEMLAVAWVHHQRLAHALREAKQLVYASKTVTREKDESGEEVLVTKLLLRTRPELAAIADVGRRLLVLLGRFGLTPADRARVVQLSEDGSDPFAEFVR
jgi:P27 family predicted phage terminase small subunit